MSYNEMSMPAIQYHTGIFNGPINAGLLIAAGVALTAIAVGVLGILHAHYNINMGPLNSLSNTWSFGIAGAGGALLLADTITLLGLTQKHLSNKKALIKSSEAIELSELNLQLLSLCTELKNQYFLAQVYWVDMVILLQNDKGDGSIHMFPSELMREEYIKELDQMGYNLNNL